MKRVRQAWRLGLLLLAACLRNDAPQASQPAMDASQKTDEDAGAAGTKLTRAQLLDPNTCQGCHPIHFREWASSMHAYAAEDPVFLAMNRKGQRDTGGQLGDFCVRCHAPMAVIEGATVDGLNLDQVPKELKGVTCYFCHNAVGIEGDHNGKVILANDAVMRGTIDDPIDAVAHGAAYSEYMDRRNPNSSKMCGACHDVVTPNGVHLERTSKEYHASAFADPEGKGFLTCQSCHMSYRDGNAATIDGVEMPVRRVHEHLWPAVDIALSPFPDRDAYRTAVECALSLGVKVSGFSVSGTGDIGVTIETEVGHSMPSGAAQDRRLWVEVVAYDNQDKVIFQSGAVDDDEVVDKLPTDPGYDPYLKIFRDYIYDADGNEVHAFWEAEKSAAHPNGYESILLPTPAIFGRPHTVSVTYRLNNPNVARVTMRMRMRPMGLDILHELVESGDLDPAVVSQMPTFTVYGTEVEWRRGDDPLAKVVPKKPPISCPKDFRCVYDPAAPGCQ